MAKDTLRLKLIATADFQTIQIARRILNNERQKTILTGDKLAGVAAHKMSRWVQEVSLHSETATRR